MTTGRSGRSEPEADRALPEAGPPSSPPRDRRALPLQVRDWIRTLIRSEGLHPGDRLPTEAELAARFGVARTTAREALKLLEQDGLVDVRHGLGRYVSRLATVERPITRLESVTEMMGSRGLAVASRVAGVGIGPATDEEAAALDLPAGAEVIRLERARLDRGEPVIYSIDVVPRVAIEGPLDSVDWSGSLIELLERDGRRVVSAVAQIQAALLPPAGVRALGDAATTAADPWILLIQRNLDDAGRVVIYSHDYYRADRFTFNVVRRREE